MGETVLPEDGPRLPLTRHADSFAVADPASGRAFHFLRGIDTNGEHPTTVVPLAAITDRNEHRIDLDYDADGALTAIRHSGGYHLDVDSQQGLVTEIRLRTPPGEPDVVLMRYDYDESGNLTGVVNSSGLPLRFDYDEHGRMIRWEDRNGTWYRYTYDDLDRCVATMGINGCLAGTITYDKSERRTVETNSLGHATAYHFNDALQIERVVNPLDGVTAYEWDRYDRKLAETDPLGRTIRWTYDQTGNVVAVTRPDGTSTAIAYNNLQLPVTITAPDGTVWQREYNERGNLVGQTDPLGATTTYAYDNRGCVRRVIDALGYVRQIEPNAAGLPIAMTDALNATTHYAYDPYGRVVEITDALGGKTHLNWTIEGQLASRTLPGGATDQWLYDAEGNLVESIDALGQVTRTEIGPFDLSSAQTGPDGALVTFAYDTELRLISVTNPQGLVWRYEYDPAGRVVRETDFNGRILTYSYDAAGQLVERTNGAGETTRMVRDLLGCVIKQWSSDTLTQFSYDLAGRVTSATNGDCELTFQRDPLGRVLSETFNGRTLTSRYDARGRKVERRTPSGAVSTWKYGAADQPLMLHAGGYSLTFVYDALGRETERRVGDALTIAQRWDADDRLLSQAVTVSVPGAPEDTRLVQRRAYSYRVDGYVVGVEDLFSGHHQLDLDPVGRITAVTQAGGGEYVERYAYDPAGNVTFASWPSLAAVAATPASVLDAQGEREYIGTLIRRAGKVRYEHDAQGRVVLRQEKRLSQKPRTWRYFWDANDRLTGVVTPDGHRWRYRYDPFGRRFAKERLADDGQTIVECVEFSWDGVVLAEQNRSEVSDLGQGFFRSQLTTWDWQPNSFHPISQIEHDSSDKASQEIIDEKFNAIVTDFIGTPTHLVTPDGDVSWHQRTTVWGAHMLSEPQAAECYLRFPGQYFDAETHFHYNFFRHYDAFSARYMSSDPAGLAFELNPHAYVDNPLNWIDPLGLGSYTREGEILTSRAARREAMRRAGIPTSQQFRSQTSTKAGYQYVYDVPAPGGGTRVMTVTDQTTDRVKDHGPHWEAGPAKIPERLDGLGRLRVTSGKSKIDYGE